MEKVFKESHLIEVIEERHEKDFREFIELSSMMKIIRIVPNSVVIPFESFGNISFGCPFETHIYVRCLEEQHFNCIYHINPIAPAFTKILFDNEEVSGNYRVGIHSSQRVRNIMRFSVTPPMSEEPKRVSVSIKFTLDRSGKGIEGTSTQNGGRTDYFWYIEERKEVKKKGGEQVQENGSKNEKVNKFEEKKEGEGFTSSKKKMDMMYEIEGKSGNRDSENLSPLIGFAQALQSWWESKERNSARDFINNYSLSSYEGSPAGFTLFMQFSCIGATQFMELMLDYNLYKLNTVDNLDNNALHWAYFFQNEDSIKFLEKQQGINSRKENWIGLKPSQFLPLVETFSKRYIGMLLPESKLNFIKDFDIPRTSEVTLVKGDGRIVSNFMFPIPRSFRDVLSILFFPGGILSYTFSLIYLIVVVVVTFLCFRFILLFILCVFLFTLFFSRIQRKFILHLFMCFLSVAILQDLLFHDVNISKVHIFFGLLVLIFVFLWVVAQLFCYIMKKSFLLSGISVSKIISQTFIGDVVFLTLLFVSLVYWAEEGGVVGWSDEESNVNVRIFSRLYEDFFLEKLFLSWIGLSMFYVRLSLMFFST